MKASITATGSFSPRGMNYCYKIDDVDCCRAHSDGHLGSLYPFLPIRHFESGVDMTRETADIHVPVHFPSSKSEWINVNKDGNDKLISEFSINEPIDGVVTVVVFGICRSKNKQDLWCVFVVGNRKTTSFEEISRIRFDGVEVRLDIEHREKYRIASFFAAGNGMSAQVSTSYKSPKVLGNLYDEYNVHFRTNCYMCIASTHAAALFGIKYEPNVLFTTQSRLRQFNAIDARFKQDVLHNGYYLPLIGDAISSKSDIIFLVYGTEINTLEVLIDKSGNLCNKRLISDILKDQADKLDALAETYRLAAVVIDNEVHLSNKEKENYGLTIDEDKEIF